MPDTRVPETLHRGLQQCSKCGEWLDPRGFWKHVKYCDGKTREGKKWKIHRCKYYHCKKSFYSKERRDKHEINCPHRDDECMRLVTLHLPINVIELLDWLVKKELYPNRSEATRHFLLIGLEQGSSDLVRLIGMKLVE